MSSTKTLKNLVPKVVEHHAKNGNFVTKEVLYSIVRDHQEKYPWDYGQSVWSSTFGSLRSWISDVVRNKLERTLKNVHSFEKEGVLYFYTDIQQVFNQVQTVSNIESIDGECPKIRQHVNFQYMIADMSTYAGFRTYIARTDTHSLTNYGGSINSLLHKKLENRHPSDDGYWLDISLTDGSQTFNGEVEESTNVHAGLERLMDGQRKNPTAKSFVISSLDQYKVKYDNLTQNTYQDLRCVFIMSKSVESIYNKVKSGDKFNINPDEMKNILVSLLNGHQI